MTLGLAFSGGKDSLACWYLMRDYNPIVFWVNTGKAYPETLALIDEIRAEAGEFIEVRSDQQKQIDENGLPSELVPIGATAFGMQISGEGSTKVQSHLQCCYDNIAQPILKAVHERGVTHLIRGQRNDEANKSTSRDGDMVDGIVFVQPIETWTKERVLDFIKTHRGSIPEHFSIEHSSLDCYDCTGFIVHSHDRIAWTKARHPQFYAAYAENMRRLKAACTPAIEQLGAVGG